jgi:glycosyltransferase involved in cell wall biosynthesis
MKILFIHTLYYPHIVGGAEVVLRVLAEATCGNGHEVVVLATGYEKGIREETINGITVYRVGIKNTYWPYGDHPRSIIRKVIWHTRDIYNHAMRRYVREVLRKEKPDVVSCHNLAGWSISVWDAVREAGIPIVQVLHDLYFLCLKSTMFKNNHPCRGRCVECKVVRFLHRYKSRQVDAVVGVSTHIIDRLTTAGFFPNALKMVVYNVIAVPEIPMSEKEKKHEFIFGFIGSLTRSKGIEWLIQEFKKINSRRVFLKIAGRGESSYVEYLKRLGSDDSRVIFSGFSKPEEFYSSIDILIVPSIGEESLGMVAIEACAYHLPVITSGRGGLREIIIDGYNGLYYDISIPNSLSSTMKRIISDRKLFGYLRGNTRESVLSFLDIDRWMCDYNSLYQKICRKKKKW